MLSTIHDELEVRCLPGDLVDSFEVDLSRLQSIGDAIHVSTLGIDTTKYDIITPETEVVVMAEEAKEIEIEEGRPELDLPTEEESKSESEDKEKSE